jgi:hypothetical protein
MACCRPRFSAAAKHLGASWIKAPINSSPHVHATRVIGRLPATLNQAFWLAMLLSYFAVKCNVCLAPFFTPCVVGGVIILPSMV